MICTKTAVVDGKLTNVLTEQEYSENYKLYENNQNMYANSAMEIISYLLGIRLIIFQVFIVKDSYTSLENLLQKMIGRSISLAI